MSICTNLTKIATLSIVTIFVLSCSKIDIPDNPGNKTYSITLKGNTDDSDTRAVYDGTTYQWEPNDHVGLFMSRTGVSSYVLSNIDMTSQCVTPCTITTFTGTVNQSDINGITGRSERFDFYSYFPYQAGANCNTFPIVKWNMPSNITLQPGVFNYNYAPMVANKVSSHDPITWLDGGGVQQFGDNVGFMYNHLMSFIKLELTYNLNGSPITKIQMESTNGVRLSGTFNIDLETGAAGYDPAASSTSLTINIPGGLNVNTTGNEYIYVPVPPGANTFKLTFTNSAGEVIRRSTVTAGSALTETDKTINATFVKKNIHRMGVGVPGYINFEQLNYSSTNGTSPGSGVSYKGFTLSTGSGNSNTRLKDNHVELNGASSHRNRGVLKISPFVVTNTLGKASFEVEVTIQGCGFASYTSGANRRILVSAATAVEYDLSEGKDPYFQYSYYLTNTWGWENYKVASYQSHQNITITPTSYLTFHLSSSNSGATGRIKKVWVTPK